MTTLTKPALTMKQQRVLNEMFDIKQQTVKVGYYYTRPTMASLENKGMVTLHGGTVYSHFLSKTPGVSWDPPSEWVTVAVLTDAGRQVVQQMRGET